MLLRGKSVTVATPHDPPHIGIAPGYNFVGSQVGDASTTFHAASPCLLSALSYHSRSLVQFDGFAGLHA